MEQRTTLSSLLNKGYLDRPVYLKSLNALVQELIAFLKKNKEITEYSEELFDKAAAEKERRAVRLKRTDRIKVVEKVTTTYAFTMGRAKEKHEDPFTQAAYIYSLIRNEEDSSGGK